MAAILLSDATIPAAYELTGHELTTIIRERNSAPAAEKGIVFNVTGGSDHVLVAHRGGLLCLITSNLVQHAIDATAAGRSVTASLRDNKSGVSVLVTDEGPGIPEDLQAHLFEPGCTGRPGGSGLGLAVSHLLARLVDTTLELKSTGPAGTVFGLWLPHSPSAPVPSQLRATEYILPAEVEMSETNPRFTPDSDTRSEASVRGSPSENRMKAKRSRLGLEPSNRAHPIHGAGDVFVRMR